MEKDVTLKINLKIIYFLIIGFTIGFIIIFLLQTTKSLSCSFISGHDERLTQSEYDEIDRKREGLADNLKTLQEKKIKRKKKLS